MTTRHWLVFGLGLDRNWDGIVSNDRSEFGGSTSFGGFLNGMPSAAFQTAYHNYCEVEFLANTDASCAMCMAPEPATPTLAGSSVVGLAGFHWRRRRAA